MGHTPARVLTLPSLTPEASGMRRAVAGVEFVSTLLRSGVPSREGTAVSVPSRPLRHLGGSWFLTVTNKGALSIRIKVFK